MAVIADALRRMNMPRAAAWLEGITDTDAARMLAAARAYVERGDTVPASRISDMVAAYSHRPAPFYSALARAVAAEPARMMDADGWMRRTRGWVSKGIVKVDEVEWSGLEDWLRGQSAKIPREAVLEYLRAGGVKVETTVLDTADRKRQYDEYAQDEYDANFDDLTPDQQAIIRAGVDGAAGMPEGPDNPNPAGGAKYANYQLPGGERLPRGAVDAAGQAHLARRIARG
jgi:hypothetical protein